MTLYEKLLLLTYYNPRIKLYKRTKKHLPYSGITTQIQMKYSINTVHGVFTDTLNILTEKDFKQLIKCL